MTHLVLCIAMQPNHNNAQLGTVRLARLAVQLTDGRMRAESVPGLNILTRRTLP